MNIASLNEVKSFLEASLNMTINSIQYIDEGISNFNYLVNESLIVKFKDDRISLSNNVENEKKVIKVLKVKGLTPRHLIKPSFTLVEYMPHASYLNRISFYDHVDNLIHAIKTIHQLDTKGMTPFDMIGRLNSYKTRLHETIVLPKLDEVILKTQKHLQAAKLKVTHNDLVRGNILIVNNTVKIIDFEYTGLNDPDFDVVSFLSENMYVDEDIRSKFLVSYYKDEKIPKEKLKDYELFADALWFYWAHFCYQETKKAIFLEIASIKKQKYLNALI